MARFPIILACGLLAGCGPAEQGDPSPPRDPAIMAALAEPLLSDPDLAAAQTATILTGGGPAQGWVPLFGPSAQEAARTREEAAGQFDGPIPPAPPPHEEQRWPQLIPLPTAAMIAAQLPFAARCAGSLAYGFRWAADLPEDLPVYPRAQVQEAAGSDAHGCRLRVVNFRSAARVQDLADFYHAAAVSAGLAPQVTRAGTDLVISGEANGLTFVLYVRSLPGGMSEADFVTSGG